MLFTVLSAHHTGLTQSRLGDQLLTAAVFTDAVHCSCRVVQRNLKQVIQIQSWHQLLTTPGPLPRAMSVCVSAELWSSNRGESIEEQDVT